MHIDGLDFVITPTELVGAAIRFGIDEAQLSVIPAAIPTDSEEAALDASLASLSSEDKQRLRELVADLAAPTRTAALGYSLADETISRQILAWPDQKGDEIVYLARQGGPWRLGRRPADEVRTLIRGVLAADDGLRADPLGLGLEAPAVVTLLGIIDWLRAARLFAELEHQVPTNMFTAEGAHSRLAGAEIEDFRWPLAFFDKFYPGNLGALGLDDVGNALVELRKAGIVEPVDEETQSMFTLTPPGEIVADVFFHEVSKVALHITECRPDGALGHETVLLARGVFNLVLFDVDGETGAVAALGSDELNEFVTSLLQRPDEDRAAWARQPLAPTVAVPEMAVESRCWNCDAIQVGTSANCSECGALGQEGGPETSITCPSCSSPVRASNRFCVRCGSAIAADG